jgi:hypothetical protein
VANQKKPAMKTDLKALLQTLCTNTETLTQDRIAVGVALEKARDENAKPEVILPLEREAGLLGHTISGLRGIEANLKGLLGEPAAPVARKVTAENLRPSAKSADEPKK